MLKHYLNKLLAEAILTSIMANLEMAKDTDYGHSMKA